MSDDLPNSLAALLRVEPLELTDWEQINGNPLVVTAVVRNFLADMARAIREMDEVI